MIFHRHKWGPIDGGYQYCKKCGLASCVHEYELIKEIEFKVAFTLGDPNLKPHVEYVSRCKNCGDIISVTVE